MFPLIHTHLHLQMMTQSLLISTKVNFSLPSSAINKGIKLPHYARNTVYPDTSPPPPSSALSERKSWKSQHNCLRKIYSIQAKLRCQNFWVLQFSCFGRMQINISLGNKHLFVRLAKVNSIFICRRKSETFNLKYNKTAIFNFSCN